MADTPKKKKDAAIRVWLDGSGNPLPDADSAQVRGIRYIHLPTSKRLKPDYNDESDPPVAGAHFDQMFGDNVGTMQFAAFGALTLAGNIASQVTNEKNPKGDAKANPIPAIADRFQSIFDGIWSDREGTGGVRFDKDALVLAVLAIKAMPDNPENRDKVVARLETRVDGKTGADAATDAKGAVSWGAFALRNPTIKAKYDEITGGGVSLDQIKV